MTLQEILTHLASAAGVGGPTIGLLISERSKRKTAEAQKALETDKRKAAESKTTEHIASAIDEATKGIRTTLDQVKSIADSAMKKADDCEKHRASEKADCTERIDKLEFCMKRDQDLLEGFERAATESSRRAESMYQQYTELRKLVDAMKPSTTHNGVVE